MYSILIYERTSVVYVMGMEVMLLMLLIQDLGMVNLVRL